MTTGPDGLAAVDVAWSVLIGYQALTNREAQEGTARRWPQGEPQQLRPRYKRRCDFPLGERTLRKWRCLFDVDFPSCAYEGWMERESCHQPCALRGTEQDLSLENQRDFTWRLKSISELFAARRAPFHT